MNSRLYYLFFILFAACISACSDGDDGNEGSGGEGDSGLVLTVDQDSIAQITGKAVFTITFNGKDITKQGSIINKATLKPLESNVFSVIKPGEYTFYAAALGSITNEVTVVVVPTILRLFQKNVLYLAITSVSCSNCPTVHRGIEKQVQLNPGRNCIIALHGVFGKEVVDPYAVDYTATYQDRYGLSGTFGPAMADHWESVDPEDMSNVEKCYLVPGYVGLSLQTALNGNNATVTVKIKALDEFQGLYTLGVAVVEDGLPFKQLDGNSWIDNYTHNDVLRYCMTDVFGEKLPEGTIDPLKEVSRTYTWNNIPAGYDKSKLRVVAFIIEDRTTTIRTKNCRDVKLGENADYQYFDYFEQ